MTHHINIWQGWYIACICLYFCCATQLHAQSIVTKAPTGMVTEAVQSMQLGQVEQGRQVAQPRATLGLGTVKDIALWQGQFYSVGGAGLVSWSSQATDPAQSSTHSTHLTQGRLFAMPDLQSMTIGAQGILTGDARGRLLAWQASAEGWQPQAMYHAHEGIVQQVRHFGEYVASAGDDGLVKLWRWQAGSLCLLHSLQGHDGRVYAVAFSPDGRFLASGGRDGHTVIWDVASGQQLLQLARGGLDVFALSFSPDGRQLATGSFDSALRVWDVATGSMLWQQEAHSRAIRGVYFATGGQIYSVSEDGTLVISQQGTSQPLYSSTSGHKIIALAADNTSPAQVYVADNSGDIYAWSTADNRVARVLQGHSSGISVLANMPTGAIVTGDLAGYVALWSADYRLQARHNLHEGSVLALTASPDGRFLASGGQEREVYLWDTLALQQATSILPLRTLSGHLANITVLHYSPDGRYLASGSVDKSVRLWDTDTGQQIALMEGSRLAISGIGFTADGQSLWASSYDGGLRRWNLADGSMQQEIRLNALIGQGQAGLQALQMLANGDMLVSTDTGAIVRISPQGQVLAQITAREASVALALTTTGFASAGQEGLIELWADNGAVMGSFVAHQAGTLSMVGGGKLVTGSRDGVAKIWELEPLPVATTNLSETMPLTSCAVGADINSTGTGANSVANSELQHPSTQDTQQAPATYTTPDDAISHTDYWYNHLLHMPHNSIPSLLDIIAPTDTTTEVPFTHAITTEHNNSPALVSQTPNLDTPIILQQHTNATEAEKTLNDWFAPLRTSACPFVQRKNVGADYTDFIITYSPTQDCSGSTTTKTELRLYYNGALFLKQGRTESEYLPFTSALFQQHISQP